jgi:hypothetical protein
VAKFSLGTLPNCCCYVFAAFPPQDYKVRDLELKSIGHWIERYVEKYREIACRNEKLLINCRYLSKIDES